MEIIKNLPPKIKRVVKRLPDVKPHLDLIAASLTIPVLITAVLLNFGNLQSKFSGQNTLPTPTALPVVTRIFEQTPAAKTIIVTSSPQPTSVASCQPGIGNITIASPTEGQAVTNNPVCITINYQAGNYCSVVWAYKVNGGPLSDYGNDSVCLYNLPSGTATFSLSVKSLVNSSTETLTRTFTVVGATPTPTQVPTTIPTPTPTQGS